MDADDEPVRLDEIELSEGIINFYTKINPIFRPLIEYDYVFDFNDGFAAVRLNGKWNFINHDGQILSKQWFEKVGDFIEGFGRVQLNGKWNFINVEGQLLSEQWFDGVQNFVNGFAIVRLNDKRNFINTKGQLLSKQWFDSIDNFYKSGIAFVKLDGKKYFIDTKGDLTLYESHRPLSPIITESILKRIKSECIKRLMDIK